jgi:hypothetical protein
MRVQFLDVNQAVAALAATAGLQFTRNMQNWSAAASHLDLSDVIRRHEEVEAELERKRAAGECAAAAAGQCGGAAGAGDGDADAVAAAMSMGERRRERRAERAPRRPAVPIVDVTRRPLPNAPSFSLYCL